MSDVLRRIAKYELRLDPPRLKELLESQQDDVRHRAGAWFLRFAAIREGVLGVLRSEPVFTINYPLYYNFALQVDKVQRKFGGGDGMVEEVAVLLTKWSERGAVPAILDRIRDELFGIPAPSVP